MTLWHVAAFVAGMVVGAIVVLTGRLRYLLSLFK